MHEKRIDMTQVLETIEPDIWAEEIAWLREKGRMDVAFATIEGTGVYAPLRATASTQIGPVRVYATRFEILAK